MKRLLPRLLLPLLFLLSACQEELVCDAGEADCDGRCVALATDHANCGACGVGVGALGDCVDGAVVCAADATVCGGVCVDAARDPLNCGGCAVPCAATDFCTTQGGTTSCTASCPSGFTACGRACVDLDADHYNCGACGHACPGGQVCTAGECRPDLVVACGSTSEVVPVTAALGRAEGARSTVTGGPTSIAVHGGAVLSANGYPAASVGVLPFDPLLASRIVTVAGSDLQHIGVLSGVAIVSNASTGSLVFLTPAGDLLDEVALPGSDSFPNPHGFAASGTTLYVALYGSGIGAGQSIAKVDLGSLADCVASPGTAPCATVTGEIDLLAVTGAFDAPGRPFPSGVLAAGGRVFVTLANLKEAAFSCGESCTYTAWAEPAGHGRLARIDPANADAVDVIDLGAGCGNPGDMALDGSTLWVACGSWSFPDLAPGALVPVDLAQDPPVAGVPVDLSPTLPGGLAFCGGVGYATDQASGSVVRFDPVARTVETPVQVCAVGPWGYAWASDVACGH
jgi:hypothetical protein